MSRRCWLRVDFDISVRYIDLELRESNCSTTNWFLGIPTDADPELFKRALQPLTLGSWVFYFQQGKSGFIVNRKVNSWLESCAEWGVATKLEFYD
jgi:hypothetical protein